MRIIVQKFGGTSVAKPETREMAAQKLLIHIKAGLSQL